MLVERITAPDRALAHVRASKSPGPGMRLRLAEAFEAEVLGREGSCSTCAFPRRCWTCSTPTAPRRCPLHHACGRRDRRTALPDGLCARAGRGRRAHRGPALRPAHAGATGRPGRATGLRDAARGRRHLPAGAGAEPRRAHHARRVVHGARSHGGRHRPGTGARRTHRGGGHHQRARAGIGRRPGAGRAAGRRAGRYAAVHHARLPLPGRRRPAHQFPPAAIHAADAGVGAGRRGADPPRLRPRGRRTLPLLQLRRRHVHRDPAP